MSTPNHPERYHTNGHARGKGDHLQHAQSVCCTCALRATLLVALGPSKYPFLTFYISRPHYSNKNGDLHLLDPRSVSYDA